MPSALANQNPVRRTKRSRIVEESRTPPRWVFALVLVGLIIGGALMVGFLPEQPRHTVTQPVVAPASSVDANTTTRFSLFEHTLATGETIHEALIESGLSELEIVGAIAAAREHQNLSRVQPGFQVEVWKDSWGVQSVQLQLTPAKTLLLRPMGDATFASEVREIPYEVELVTFHGDVDHSLWVSASDAGMDPNIIAELADVFAWQIDFSREVYAGDKWRLAVEQRTLAGKPAGWGRIVAAEYINNGEPYTAVWYSLEDGSSSYYEPDGQSLRRMFLKSPVRFSRISSRFSRSRYHPVLKVRRPHYGVDYAAAPGTPIRAVGDGTVEFAGTNGGSGKFVKIRHNSTYQTSYSHLQSYGKNVKRGAKVKQGQVIGYIGSTGLATGPHLHFAFYENGTYVDPLSRKFPSVDPVPKDQQVAFRKVADKSLNELPDWP